MQWQISLVPGSITKARDDEHGTDLSDDAGKQVRIEVNLPQHASTEEEDDDVAEEDSARCSPSSGGNSPRHRNGIAWRCMSKFCVELKKILRMIQLFTLRRREHAGRYGGVCLARFSRCSIR